LVLVAVNDHDEPWRGELLLERQTFSGRILRSVKLSLDVPARSVARIEPASSLVSPENEQEEVLVATAPDARAVHLFREDRELAYDPEPLKAQAVAVPGGYRVDVYAKSFARDVAVLADRVAPDAVVDEMLV